MGRVTYNPYAGVSWETTGRHKASMHVHTTQSEGTASPAAMIDAYHALNYEVVALTDHDGPNFQAVPTWPWTAFGRDPAALGMLAIQGNEFSTINHIGSLFFDAPDRVMWTDAEVAGGTYTTYRNNKPWIINEIGLRGGKWQLNHPGRYSRTDQFYLDLFAAYNDHLGGMECYNQGNRYALDLARWDRLLTEMVATGARWPLWGTSVDDSHNATTHVGRNFNVYLLPELTEAALKAAITAGAFYFVYDPSGASASRHVEAGQPKAWHAAPIIDSVSIASTAIAIEARQYTSCEWHTASGELVHEGAVLPLSSPKLGGYVRATLWGDSLARTHTQPFFLGDFEQGRFIKRRGDLVPVVDNVMRDGASRPI